jgi:hypothetical protein
MEHRTGGATGGRSSGDERAERAGDMEVRREGERSASSSCFPNGSSSPACPIAVARRKNPSEHGTEEGLARDFRGRTSIKEHAHENHVHGALSFLDGK